MRYIHLLLFRVTYIPPLFKINYCITNIGICFVCASTIGLPLLLTIRMQNVSIRKSNRAGTLWASLQWFRRVCYIHTIMPGKKLNSFLFIYISVSFWRECATCRVLAHFATLLTFFFHCIFTASESVARCPWPIPFLLILLLSCVSWVSTVVKRISLIARIAGPLQIVCILRCV